MSRYDSQEHKNNGAENLSLQYVQPTVTDEMLIARVSRSDEIAFETLFNRYRRSALRLAQQFAGLQNGVEDLVHEAFLRVYLHAYQYNPETAPFRSWFFSILNNLCRDAVRRNSSHPFAELLEGAPAIDDPEGELALKEQITSLAAVIPKLSPNQREALTLYRYGFNYAEIATALGISDDAIKSLLARARRTLRQELANGEKKSFD